MVSTDKIIDKKRKLSTLSHNSYTDLLDAVSLLFSYIDNDPFYAEYLVTPELKYAALDIFNNKFIYWNAPNNPQISLVIAAVLSSWKGQQTHLIFPTVQHARDSYNRFHTFISNCESQCSLTAPEQDFELRKQYYQSDIIFTSINIVMQDYLTCNWIINERGSINSKLKQLFFPGLKHKHQAASCNAYIVDCDTTLMLDAHKQASIADREGNIVGVMNRLDCLSLYKNISGVGYHKPHFEAILKAFQLPNERSYITAGKQVLEKTQQLLSTQELAQTIKEEINTSVSKNIALFFTDEDIALKLKESLSDSRFHLHLVSNERPESLLLCREGKADNIYLLPFKERNFAYWHDYVHYCDQIIVCGVLPKDYRSQIINTYTKLENKHSPIVLWSLDNSHLLESTLPTFITLLVRAFPSIQLLLHKVFTINGYDKELVSNMLRVTKSHHSIKDMLVICE